MIVPKSMLGRWNGWPVAMMMLLMTRKWIISSRATPSSRVRMPPSRLCGPSPHISRSCSGVHSPRSTYFAAAEWVGMDHSAYRYCSITVSSIAAAWRSARHSSSRVVIDGTEGLSATSVGGDCRAPSTLRMYLRSRCVCGSVMSRVEGM